MPTTLHRGGKLSAGRGRCKRSCISAVPVTFASATASTKGGRNNTPTLVCAWPPRSSWATGWKQASACALGRQLQRDRHGHIHTSWMVPCHHPLAARGLPLSCLHRESGCASTYNICNPGNVRVPRQSSQVSAIRGQPPRTILGVFPARPVARRARVCVSESRTPDACVGPDPRDCVAHGHCPRIADT